MYRVLYRKWRPATFTDVVGQEHITATLKNEITSNHLAHAYLFTGSRGTGKTTCAKIFARAVNCQNPKDGNPCCECEICKGIENGSILDVEEIDAASNNSVQNIRELRDMINYKPAAGRFRVYIIDEVHMLSSGAFNALLKTLEEPPEHVIFILATTEVHKLPATILSRCQRFDFFRIDSEAIASRLMYVAKEENLSLDREAATLIARLSDGALRDALSLLDRCSLVGEITVEKVMDIAGVLGSDHLFGISEGVSRGDIAAVLNSLEAFHEASKEMNRVCDQLISHFRNLMICKTVKTPAELISCTPDELLRYRNCAEGYSLAEILKVIERLQSALERMKYGASKRAELEMALIMSMPQNYIGQAAKAVSVAPTDSTPVALKQVEIVEKPIAKTSVETFDDTPAEEKISVADLIEDAPSEPIPKAKPATKAVTPPPSQASDEPQYFIPWPEVITNLTAKNRLMAAVLKGTEAYIDGNLVLIKCDSQDFLDMINSDPKNKQAIREAIAEVTGMTCRLGPYRPSVKKESDPLADFLGNVKKFGVLSDKPTTSEEDEQ